MLTDGVVLKKARLVEEEVQSEKEERRRWEEMDMDCLANVFSKAGIESLVLDVPFVCKSWYRASLSPICWTSLYFPDNIPSPLFVNNVEEIGPQSFGTFYDKFVDEYGIDKSRFSITGFVKLVVERSKGKATRLKLPMCSTETCLRYVSDACPLLKTLMFMDDPVIFKSSQILPEVIGKWKFLETLHLGGSLLLVGEQFSKGKYLSKDFRELLTSESPSCYNVLERILVQIGTHCKHFRWLSLELVPFGQVEALTIVNFLPHLRGIKLAGGCLIERDSLFTIFRGCKELQLFYADDCVGFEDDDEEIYNLACQTCKVVCKGCVAHDELESELGDLARDVPTLLRKFVFTSLRMRG